MSDQHPNQKQVRQRCPKGMKLPTHVKAMAAALYSHSTAERKHFMRTMGTALHEAALNAKRTQRDSSSGPRSNNIQSPAADAE